MSVVLDRCLGNSVLNTDVPQYSILDLTLLQLYIRNLCDDVVSNIAIYPDNTLVIRQKGESQNECFNKTKRAKFSEK